MTVSLKLSQLKKPDRFASWLRSITIHKCQMWLRSQIHTPDLQPLPEHLLGTSTSSGDSHDTIGAESLLRQLSPGLQAAAVLCFEDELSPSAAAAQLGIKPSTLRKRLHDARVWLQRRIVENAEKKMRLHVLPRDFAEKCVCRCRRALSEKARKEVIQMADKKNCGCGCLGAVKKSKSKKSKSKKTK